MSLTPEWRRRIERWRDVMPSLFYRPLGTVDFEFCRTRDALTPREAEQRTFRPMPSGTAWGAAWEYAWFRARLTVPRAAAGRRIVLRADTGGEALIFVNGMAAGAKGWADREITLTRQARGGEQFAVLIEAYAGHGPMECGGGPVPHGTEAVPAAAPRQVRVGDSTFGIWEEELFQLWVDTETLWQLRNHLKDAESLRVDDIDEALKRMTFAVDFEEPPEAMIEGVRAARRALRPVLACVNGSTSPFMSCFGHAHIDVAWLWPLQETERKCSRTFASQLALMDEYPEYRFLQSQPHLYCMTRERDPALYERIRKAVAKGQWIPEGGMWVEADTNATGGESLVRQILHGKRFFREEFGVDSALLWLPDVFGYSGALPQIMAGCGLRYFSSSKIFWIYGGGDPFPYNLFQWEGIDGTRVLAYMHNNYNSETHPEAVLERWHERVQKDAVHRGRLLPFGYGDGGGGATRKHLEFLRRMTNLEGLPRCEIRDPGTHLAALEPRDLPVWTGELYFQNHRGTYTSQARLKQGNRRCETGLRELELWGAVARARCGHPYPLADADRLWKDVLLCQFHDILPGSSIRRVNQEAEALHARVQQRAQALAGAARNALLQPDRSACTVFNSLSWDRAGLVELPPGFQGAAADGGPLPVQVFEGRTYVALNPLPSCGWTSLRRADPGAAPPDVCRADGSRMENDRLVLTLNARGELTSIHDKATGREWAAGLCNRFRLYKDVPGWFDAWDIDSLYKQDGVDLDAPATIEPVAQGPLFAILRVTRMLNRSRMSQDIVLRAGCRRVDFRTTIDWREKHKLLKVNFPVTVHANEALHEIQFGHLSRPTHATRAYDADRFEVCNQKWTALAETGRGAAVLNDGKYGISVEGNSLNLTLLKSAQAPDMMADQGPQSFTYALYGWDGPLTDSGLIQEAYDLNTPLVVVAGRRGNDSVFRVDAPHIVIEAVKPAEDGSDDVVVRLYEALRTATRCVLRANLPFRNVRETDMLEQPRRRIAHGRGGVIPLEFRPFEIKTLRFERRRAPSRTENGAGCD